MTGRAFRQVDVFAGSHLGGNPVAVVLDAEGLDDAAMAAFARWTHLSETTFVLPPTDPAADYRLRIFTPAAELPFAGHPTLGSAHAWAEHTGSSADRLVQECGVGLVDLRRTDDGWALAAPPLIRSGPATAEEAAEVAAALRLRPVGARGRRVGRQRARLGRRAARRTRPRCWPSSRTSRRWRATSGSSARTPPAAPPTTRCGRSCPRSASTRTR